MTEWGRSLDCWLVPEENAGPLPSIREGCDAVPCMFLLRSGRQGVTRLCLSPSAISMGYFEKGGCLCVCFLLLVFFPMLSKVF